MSENNNSGNSGSPFAEALGKSIGAIVSVTIIVMWATIVASWTLEFIRG